MNFGTNSWHCARFVTACGITASCAASVAPEDARDAPIIADVPSADAGDAPAEDPNHLGNCFEVFPEIDPRYPDADVSRSHASNPLSVDFGSVPLDASSLASLRYYNFCGDTHSIVLGTELSGEDGGAAAPGFTLEEAPPPGSSVYRTDPGGSFGLYVRVRFSPSAPGTLRAVARYRVSHGYYETHFAGTGVAR